MNRYYQEKWSWIEGGHYLRLACILACLELLFMAYSPRFARQQLYGDIDLRGFEVAISR
jgi:hypothetical protein